MKTIVINGQLRSEMGKGASRRLRSEGNALAVVYGKTGEKHFYAPLIEFRDIVYTSEFKLAEINIDGSKIVAILKDTQFDPISDKLIHADFLELNDDIKVIAELPVKLVGQAAGVKAGGRLEQKMKTVKVRTFPKFLKDAIEIDITKLELNANIRVEDIKDENFEFLNPSRQPIASIVMTRALRQAESADKKGK